MGRALEFASKNIVFCSASVNTGHGGKPGPFGSPDLAKFTQYVCIRFVSSASPGCGVALKTPVLANTKETSEP